MSPACRILVPHAPGRLKLIDGPPTVIRRVERSPGRYHLVEAPSDYGGPVVRNLVYHVGPFRGNGAWRRNVEQLLRRIRMFNGRRCVAVMTGPRMDPVEQVVEAFRGEVDDFLALPNDTGLREVASFERLLSRVETNSPREITFFAHTKGVTRPANDSTTVHRWADLMYETCLDYRPLVERALATHPIAGSFKKVGFGFGGSRSSWHYTGGYFWLRNRDVSARNWREVDRQWWGAESWPGLHFRPHEAACLFMCGVVPTLDLYDYRYMHDTVLPAYERWKEQHARERVP